ncbi:MAG TPA: M36 family metallopeptidase, partial [Blastocatellia bacterium]|nr:M36 family metallopeptidase [Blastocatellia bacterium]
HERSRAARQSGAAQVRWGSLADAPSRLFSTSEALTRPSAAEDAERAARRFLREREELFRLRPDEVEELRVARRYRTGHNGLTHVTLQQQVGGIDVFQGEFTAHMDGGGGIIAASGELIPDLAHAVNLTRPALTAEAGLRLAAAAANAEVRGTLAPASPAEGPDERQEFDREGASGAFARRVGARLVYFPLAAGQARLAWQFILWLRETPDVYLILIDAGRGSLLYRYNLTAHQENPLKPHGQVFTGESPRPNAPYSGDEAPPLVEREDAPFHATPFNVKSVFPVSDPHFDWWAGAAATVLVGNNADVRLDRDGNNQPDPPRLSAPDGNFSFPLDFALQPTTGSNQRAAQVNLFYWVNRFHDILYDFGFDEAAGNFQRDNFGRGGAGGDPVIADAQDGGGINNANFTSPPDGEPGRLQMYLWSGMPQRDGDYDQGVIIHELTHGLSSRLVGNGTGLAGVHGRGLSEGWSDYFSVALMRREGDRSDGAYPVGQYVRDNPARGVRRYAYSTDPQVNPLTFGDIKRGTGAHAVGEIWGNMLWEARALLIARHGFAEGQRQSLQLVVDGLKLTPVAPTFVDARDAILLADRVNNGGANQCLLWQAFAKRGLGHGAGAFDTADAAPRESFEPPAFCSETGLLSLDRSNYLAGEEVGIRLGDRNAPAPLAVQVTSTVSGDQEIIALEPDPVFVGSFSGKVRLGPGRARPGDGSLQASVEARDQIVVAYLDARTATGGAARVEARAGVAREATVFEDTVERGNQGWIATGGWAIAGARAASPTRAWADSPAGNYASNSRAALTSPPLDLTDLTDVVLTFAQSYDFERNFDFGVVEYSLDEGETWSRAAAFTGSQAAFNQARVRLDALAGATRARLRFQVLADALQERDGWSLDDLRLLARPARAEAVPAAGLVAPAVTEVNPAFGPPGGGTRVTITGANFSETAETSVSFDGIPAPSFTVLGGMTIVATVPPHAPGAATVRVTNRQGAASLAGGFTYFVNGTAVGAPSLLALFPASGSTRGGTGVTIIGDNFTPETEVRFGSELASWTFVNAHTLRVITPPAFGGAAGPVSVSARRQDGVGAALPDAFSYAAPSPPSLRVLSPNGGEKFFVGNTVTIRWQSSDDRRVARHRVALFRDSGASPPVRIPVADIAADLPGEAQSCTWSVPATLPTTGGVRVGVTAVDDEGAETQAFAGGEINIARRWETAPPLPLALQRPAVASDGRFIYVIGGRTSSSNASTSETVHRFDPAGSAPPWVSLGLSTMPVGINGGEGAFLNGRIYLPGGTDASAAINPAHQAYDVAANRWSALKEPPTGVTAYAVAADEGRGVYYLTGGSANAADAVSAAFVYDPQADEWGELPRMTVARSGHEAALIEGKLYVAGGSGVTGGLASGEVHDFEKRQWSPTAGLHRPRRYATNFIGRGAAGQPLWFVVGGEDPDTGALLASAEVYDPRADRWTALDDSFSLPVARTLLGGAAVGNAFYAVGGAAVTLVAGLPLSVNTSERFRLEDLSVESFDLPPALAVPPAQVAIVGMPLEFRVTAGDLGAGRAITIMAEGLPAEAVFEVAQTSVNSARGTLRWTPGDADVGRTVTLTFTASDGQLSDVKTVAVRVARAGRLAVVNAADFRAGPIAADSIAAAFGIDLAARPEQAEALPLPHSLAGTTVTVNGLPAPLFFVSPTQINFAVPAGVGPGAATIIVSHPFGIYSVATAQIAPSAPALFTVSATGTGDAAALATADGVSYQPPPFDISAGGRPNILILYGTGIRHPQAAAADDDDGVAEAVSVTIDGLVARVLYAGAQGQFTGLDQINVELPGALAGGRRVEVV